MEKHYFKSQAIWFKRAFKNAWQNLLRNKILSLATVLIISLMIFVFNLILAMTYASDSIISGIGERLDISIEINNGIENYSIQTFIEKIRKNPSIKKVIYISKEDALKQFGSKYPNVISFLEHNKLSNPLPNTVRIITKDVTENNAVIDFLESPQFSSIINQEKLIKNLEQKSRNEKILNITLSIRRISFWFIFIFALVGLMIIFNSININIHNHSDEINIMKLVGAKYNFIRGGFIMEGIGFSVSEETRYILGVSANYIETGGRKIQWGTVYLDFLL